MFMPTRNVYVSDKDQALFREAAEIAGGLSPAVSEALHEYVQRRRLVAASLKQIEVDLRSEVLIAVSLSWVDDWRGCNGTTNRATVSTPCT